MVLIGLASSAIIYVYEWQKPSGYHLITNGPRLLNLCSHVISGKELEELEEWPLNAAYPKDTLLTTITEDLFLNKFSMSTESNNSLKSKYLASYGCLFFID